MDNFEPITMHMTTAIREYLEDKYNIERLAYKDFHTEKKHWGTIILYVNFADYKEEETTLYCCEYYPQCDMLDVEIYTRKEVSRANEHILL